MREGDRAQQRLHVEPVRNLDLGAKLVGQTERQDLIRRRQQGEAVRLKAPEFIVVDQIIDRLLERGEPRLVEVSLDKLLARGLEQFARSMRAASVFWVSGSVSR